MDLVWDEPRTERLLVSKAMMPSASNRLVYLLTLALPIACGGDSSSSSGDGDADGTGTESATGGTGTTLTGGSGSMSNTDSAGTMSNTGQDSTGGATDSMSASATDSASGSATDSATDSASGSTGGRRRSRTRASDGRDCGEREGPRDRLVYAPDAHPSREQVADRHEEEQGERGARSEPGVEAPMHGAHEDQLGDLVGDDRTAVALARRQHESAGTGLEGVRGHCQRGRAPRSGPSALIA